MSIPWRRMVVRWLGLIVLAAICSQMAVCMAADYHERDASSTTPNGSDCNCHDCACCSLHIGPPQPMQTFAATIVARIAPTPVPHLSKESRSRVDRPPRS
ncbi:MAG TPA: hypothetical protein VFW44_15480 [Bryobacteraceae bacterium]|nr:hypothetical protein [Bryobacteraceae bacterium]